MNTSFDLHDFVGGVHPAENKEQSTCAPIISAGIPEKLILPLTQHIGAQSKSLVEIGDTVLKGQLIAEAQGFISANMHAPTSGVITAIEDRAIAHQSGLTDLCIELTADKLDKWADHSGVRYQDLDAVDLIKIIQAAGITGMGGAGFPSHVKMSTEPGSIKTLIINAAECEPYITSDDMLMQERAADVITGIEILAYILKPESVLIGIEDNKPKAANALSEIIHSKALNPLIQVITIPTKYPSGGEKQLIQILTGKEVPSHGLPSSLGIVCYNVGTAYAINNAVTKGEPLISRITTVTGNACLEPRNYEVLIGTPVEHLLNISNTDLKATSRLVMGGPMMGFTIEQIQTPIIKASNCIIAATKEELPDPAMEQACIRCGMCTEACPAQLLPQQLYWFAKSNNLEQAENHNIADCIECGACSFVCPSNIPLVQYYRFAKGEIKQANADKQKSDRAKIRFETRLSRLDREHNEKEAKRAARAEAAAKKQAEKKAAAIAEPAASGEQDVLPTVDIEKLQKKFEATKSAITKTKEKITALENAEPKDDSKIELMKGALEKAQAKMKDAATALAEGKKSQKGTVATPTKQASDSLSAPTTKSPADELVTLQQKVLAAQTRVDKATERLNMAKEQELDTMAAFQTGLEKQQTKLDDAKQALATFMKTSEEAK